MLRTWLYCWEGRQTGLCSLLSPGVAVQASTRSPCVHNGNLLHLFWLMIWPAITHFLCSGMGYQDMATFCQPCFCFSLSWHAFDKLAWRLPSLTVFFWRTGFQGFDILWLHVIFHSRNSSLLASLSIWHRELAHAAQMKSDSALGEPEARVLQQFSPLRQCCPSWAKWVLSVWDLVYFTFFLEGCKELGKGLCELAY